jgi:hypothetical protein
MWQFLTGMDSISLGLSSKQEVIPSIRLSIYLVVPVSVVKSRIFSMHSFEERISHVNFEVEEEPVM